MIGIKHLILAVYVFLAALLPSKQYVEGVTGQPRSFFPNQIETQNDKTISDLIYRGLFRYDIYGELKPDLAESWSVSDGGLVYTVTMKKDQKWSDGSYITADDLIYTAFKTENLQGVATDKVDDWTVRFTLPNKFSPFLSLLTVGVMKDGSIESDDPLKPISSGPFIVARVEKTGPVIKQVVLLHQNPKENIKKLIFKYYSNEEELVTAAKLGEIDGFIGKDTNLTLEGFHEYKYPLQGVYYALYFNLRNEKLQDLELRQNMSKVLDIESLTQDDGIIVQGPISRSIYTDNELDFNNYDKNFSIDDSGNRIKVTITVPNIKQHTALAEKIKNIWEDKLNLDVELKKVDPENFVDEIIKDRNFEILYYGQEIGRDPDRYVNWHSTQKEFPGLNLSGFEQVRADRALEEGRNETDQAKRQVHYAEFQKVVHEDVPAIFLYHPYINYYISDYIEGIGDKYTFTITDRFLDFDNWKKISTN